MVWQRILVPLDGSELSSSVLPLLERLLAGGPAAVRLLSVAPDDDAALEEVHAAAARRLQAAGAEVSSLFTKGDPAQQILACAAMWPADAVVMATHGRSGLSRLARGSVAERVLRTCPAPLLLRSPRAADEAEPFRSVLVPLDGSEEAGRVLPLVGDLARRHGSRVTLLHVAPPDDQSQGLSPMDLARFEDSVARHRDRLEEAGVQHLQLRKARGAAAEEILAAAKDEDVSLVALSTHGHSGLRRWWLGSVAEAVLRDCARPVLIYRAGAPGEPRAAETPQRARDVMTRDVETVREDASLESFLELLKERPYSAFPVVNADGLAVGLASQTNVLRALAQLVASDEFPEQVFVGDRRAGALLLEPESGGQRSVALDLLLARPVRDLMSAPLVHCGPEDSLADVCQRMAEARVHRLLVIDDTPRIVGVITATDLIRYLGQGVSVGGLAD